MDGLGGSISCWLFGDEMGPTPIARGGPGRPETDRFPTHECTRTHHREYLTGFSKRKQERRRFGLAMQKVKDRKARLADREEVSFTWVCMHDDRGGIGIVQSGIHERSRVACRCLTNQPTDRLSGSTTRPFDDSCARRSRRPSRSSHRGRRSCCSRGTG